MLLFGIMLIGPPLGEIWAVQNELRSMIDYVHFEKKNDLTIALARIIYLGGTITFRRKVNGPKKRRSIAYNSIHVGGRHKVTLSDLLVAASVYPTCLDGLYTTVSILRFLGRGVERGLVAVVVAVAPSSCQECIIF